MGRTAASLFSALFFEARQREPLCGTIVARFLQLR
jgi:hypothetical protein